MHEELIPRTDIKISKIGFGCAHLGSKTKWQRRAESENLIAVALSLGITLFDTSAIYAQGESERILGRVLRQSAEGKRAVVITKIGYVPLPSNLAGQVAIKAIRKARRSLGLITQNPQRFDVRFLERAVDQSLMRLQRERIDVLFLHSPPASVLNDKTVIDFLGQLVRSGKVGCLGFSNLELSEGALQAAPSFNLIGSRPMQTCPSAIVPGVTGLIAYQPLQQRVGQKRLAPDVALRCCLNFPNTLAVVPGMSSIEHLTANVAAANRD